MPPFRSACWCELTDLEVVFWVGTCECWSMACWDDLAFAGWFCEMLLYNITLPVFTKCCYCWWCALMFEMLDI
jgi:hypothetical protein